MTFGIVGLAHESRFILSASPRAVIPGESPYGRVSRAPVTIRCYELRFHITRLRRIAARRRQRQRFAIGHARRMRPDSRRDSLLHPPGCASAVVLGIPMGRNRARDAGDAQLLLADDQRSRLLRQAARLLLARNFFDTLHRAPQRGRHAPALPPSWPAGSGATDAASATPLRRSHRDTRRRDP